MARQRARVGTPTGFDIALSRAYDGAQQRLVAHAEYALGAILWGRDHAFYGFEREGREALVHLATQLP